MHSPNEEMGEAGLRGFTKERASLDHAPFIIRSFITFSSFINSFITFSLFIHDPHGGGGLSKAGRERSELSRGGLKGVHKKEKPWQDISFPKKDTKPWAFHWRWGSKVLCAFWCMMREEIKDTTLLPCTDYTAMHRFPDFTFLGFMVLWWDELHEASQTSWEERDASEVAEVWAQSWVHTRTEVSGTTHNTRLQTQRHNISLSDRATVVKTSKENQRKGFHMKGFEDKR